ncbi:MAG: hypothetical protein ACK4SY_08185 [Pyrobaculum sp.]
MTRDYVLLAVLALLTAVGFLYHAGFLYHRPHAPVVVTYTTATTFHIASLAPQYERVNSTLVDDIVQFYRSRNLTTHCGEIAVYLRPDLKGYVGIAEGCTIYVKHVEPYVLAHEIAHLFTPLRGDWRQEAVAEGIALAYLYAKGYEVPRHVVDAYFTKRLYEKNPYDTKEEEWYDYAAPFAWMAQNTTDWRWAYQPEVVYLHFLHTLKDCVTIFGIKYCPEYTEIRGLYNKSYVESFRTTPYTARYFRIRTPGDFVVVSDGFIERVYPPSVTIAYVDTVGAVRRIEVSYVYIRAATFTAKINDVYITVVYLEESRNGGPFRPVNGMREINNTKAMFIDGVTVLKTQMRPRVVTIYGKAVEVRLAEHISAEKHRICVS